VAIKIFGKIPEAKTEESAVIANEVNELKRKLAESADKILQQQTIIFEQSKLIK